MPWEGDRREGSETKSGQGAEREAQKGRRWGQENAKWASGEGFPRPGPTRGTRSPRAPDGEEDHTAAFPVAPSFPPGPTQRKGRGSEASHSAASWFQGGGSRRRRGRHGGSSAAPAAPGPGRLFTCFSASPLLLFRPRRTVGGLRQQEAGLRGDSAPSLNVAPVLGDVDAAAASRRHRSNRRPTSADRGPRAEPKAPSPSERTRVFPEGPRPEAGRSASSLPVFGSFRQRAAEAWEVLARFGPFRRAKGWEKGKGKKGRVIVVLRSLKDAREARRFHLISV